MAVKPVAYKVAVAFAVLQAAFLAWRDEERKRLIADRQMTELTVSTQPDLRGETSWEIHQRYHDWPLLVVDVRVINLGAPTIVDNWALILHLKERQSISFKREYEFETRDLRTKGKEPLRMGDTLECQMFYTLSSPENIEEGDIEGVAVSFRDFLKREYVA